MRSNLIILLLLILIILISLGFYFLKNTKKEIYLKINNNLDNNLGTYNSENYKINSFLKNNILNLKTNKYSNFLDFAILENLPKGKVWLINLTKNTISLYENNELKEIISIAYKAPEDKWYQAPMGYFRLGIKKEKHYSSLFPVYMNYSVQLYEDFFIHEIPYFLNGDQVTSNFTGGCLRLYKDNAKKFYELSKEGDFVLVYKELFDYNVSDKFNFPVKKDEFFLLKNFNNPFRSTKKYSGDLDNLHLDYIQHAGIDLSPYYFAKDLNVYSIYDGKVVKIVKNGENDHGMGNTVIIEHLLDLDEMGNEYLKSKINLLERIRAGDKNYIKIYSLYAHLAEINNELSDGKLVTKGEILGKVGNTAYGCNYWKIGEDGCNNQNLPDIHLHFEIKIKPLLESPIENNCLVYNKKTKCYGYVNDNPEKLGYLNPFYVLFDL